MNSIPPNKIVHKAFCSAEISYGRTGGDFKQSLMKSLQTNKQNYIKKLMFFCSVFYSLLCSLECIGSERACVWMYKIEMEEKHSTRYPIRKWNSGQTLERKCGGWRCWDDFWRWPDLLYKIVSFIRSYCVRCRRQTLIRPNRIFGGVIKGTCKIFCVEVSMWNGLAIFKCQQHTVHHQRCLRLHCDFVRTLIPLYSRIDCSGQLLIRLGIRCSSEWEWKRRKEKFNLRLIEYSKKAIYSRSRIINWCECLFWPACGIFQNADSISKPMSRRKHLFFLRNRPVCVRNACKKFRELKSIPHVEYGRPEIDTNKWKLMHKWQSMMGSASLL